MLDVVVSLDRAELFADPTLAGTVFCRAYARRVDEWLAWLFDDKLGAQPGVSLAATGGYGRGTLSPQSDLDIMLLHSGVDDAELTQIAEQLWYPIWDEGLKLGHSVRTHKEALKLAADDLDTATSLISLRHLAGDEEMTRRTVASSQEQWRKQARKWLPELADAVDERRRTNGEVAFLLEPDLKVAGGGLRDINALGWARAAGVEFLDQEARAVRDAGEVLLATRVELHRSTGRAGDTLLLEEQDAVSDALGIDDADVLMSRVSSAARTVSWIGDDVWARARQQSRRRFLWRKEKPRMITEGLVLDNGTIYCAETPASDRVIVTLLTAAAAAAEHDARIDRAALDDLVERAPAVPEPWPLELRESFVRLLLAGHKAIPAIEALDQIGILVRLIPEWRPTRSKPQRNAYHRFTVDRHLCEAAAEASYLVDGVDRPDLLVVGALLHDIGKGYPGDHTIVGMDLVATIAPRMGFDQADTASLIAMVEHHLLLPDVATRRDIEDPETIAAVADQVGSTQVLGLLAGLTEADSIATGPSAWSSWKAGLVRDLAGRVERQLLGESESAERAFPTDEMIEMMLAGDRVVSAGNNEITIIEPDRSGLFSDVTGALAVMGLDTLSAQIHSDSGMAAQTFVVEPTLPTAPEWSSVEATIERALDGDVSLPEAIAERIATYGQPATSGATPIVQTYVVIDNDSTSAATVIEIAARNELGLLYNVTSAMASNGLDIRQARAQTLGDHVVDSFYVTDMSGDKVVDPAKLQAIEQSIMAAITDTESNPDQQQGDLA